MDVQKNTSNIGFFRAYNIGNYRQDVVAVFKAVNGYPNPNLHFYTNYDSLLRPEIYIDNVSLYQAHVTYLDPRPDFPIFANQSPLSQQFSLGGYAYFDLDSNLIMAPYITLAPYTSQILIKTNISTVGIHEYKPETMLRIYPNPTSEQLTIECPQKATIVISDIQGQIIKKFISGIGKTSVDVSNIPAGFI